ncbi:hypothetical protein D3C74_428520 [compost metagenome]
MCQLAQVITNAGWRRPPLAETGVMGADYAPQQADDEQDAHRVAGIFVGLAALFQDEEVE